MPYSCPRCGGQRLTVHLTVEATVFQGEDGSLRVHSREAYEDDIDDAQWMWCENPDCKYSGQALTFDADGREPPGENP